MKDGSMPENSGTTESHSARSSLARRRIDHITSQIETFGQIYAELETRLKDIEVQRLKDPNPSHDQQRDSVIEQMGKAVEKQQRLLREQNELIDAWSKEIDRLDERSRSHFDRIYDFQKHITTLSTASIVGIAALVQVFGSDPELIQVVGVSLGCFVIAIIAAVCGMYGDILENMAVGLDNVVGTSLRDRIMMRLLRVSLELMWVFRVASSVAFCAGLIIISLFA